MYSFTDADYQYRKKLALVALKKMQDKIDEQKNNSVVSIEKINNNEASFNNLLEYMNATEKLIKEKDDTIKMLSGKKNTNDYPAEKKDNGTGAMGNIPNKYWHKEDIREYSKNKLQFDMPHLF